jgi:serine/threonine-protein kinase
MDRDLELVTRGESVGSETEQAATMVLAGAGAIDETAATQLTPRRAPATPGGTYGGEERYRAYDGPVTRGRNWWPWVLGLGALLAVAVAGYFFYDKVQNQIDEGKPIAVGEYRGLLEPKAVGLIVAKGFQVNVRRLPNAETAIRVVYGQEPSPGQRLAKGSIVTIFVSSGKPTVRTPEVVGLPLTDAVTAITRAGLKARTVEVNSDKSPGTVTAQAPRAGTLLVSGAEVRINVSKGPKPLGVPSVVGLLYDTAASQLQAAGFAVARVDVDSEQPPGQVVAQVPTGNSTASKGSTVTLSVSNGPTTTPLPDVAGQALADARATLTAAGFKFTVTFQDTDQEVYDGIVLTQDPPGNTQQDPQTIVTLFVGRYVAPPDTTPTDTTATTPTDTTATTPTP